MKIAIWLAILLLASGCANMTPGERQTAYIVGGIVVAGVIISASNGSDSHSPHCRLVPVIDGHIEVCQ